MRNNKKYRVRYSFGGKLVYVRSKDGNVKTPNQNEAYQFDTKEADAVMDLIKESGYGSVEKEEVSL